MGDAKIITLINNAPRQPLIFGSPSQGALFFWEEKNGI
jgi:hypothetical protein